jgi:hypothetical protein
MMHTGVRVDKGQFSRDMVGTTVGDYAYTASTLSERRLNKIIALCGAHSMERQPSLKAQSAQVNRRALYVPSSPTKGSDDE